MPIGIGDKLSKRLNELLSKLKVCQVGVKKVLFIPDTHAPYHDKKVWALLVRVIEILQPDIIVILGDFADFYAVSSHAKDPNRRLDLQWEVDEVKKLLSEVRENAPNARIVYVSGNHEDRLERYLKDKAPELFNSVKIEHVLGLADLRIEYVPYKDHIQIGKIYITHEVGNCGQYAHYKAQQAFEANVIIGHTHRIGYTVVGNAKGKPHLGAMFGWLGDFDQVDYMHKIRAKRDWAHGFGIGYIEVNGNVHVTPVPVVCGAVVVEGRVIR